MLATLQVLGVDGEVAETLPAGMVCGFGRIDGRMVAVGAEDYTVAMGTPTCSYLERGKGSWPPGYIEDLAYNWEIPLVMLLQGVGGDVGTSDHPMLHSFVAGMTSSPILQLLDRVPSVTALLGPVAGGSAARAVCAHFSVMSREHGALFGGGPPLVKRSLGLQVNRFELGGHEIHLRESGAVDNGSDSEEEAFAQIKRFLSYLPTNVHALPPRVEPAADDPPDRLCEKLLEIMPHHPRRIFDPRKLIEEVVDRGSFFEIGAEWARELVQGLARIGGIPVGVFANDARYNGGALTGPAGDKQTRFAEMCDTFHIPMVYFSDMPGLMIGPDAERSGVLRRSARAIQAMHTATVPVVTVNVRRAFGLGHHVCGSPDGLQIKLAWPTTILGFGGMPVEGGAAAQFKHEIEAADDPAAKLREIEERLRSKLSVWRTAEQFSAEDVLDPRETRRVVYRWLDPAFRSQRPAPKAGPRNRP